MTAPPAQRYVLVCLEPGLTEVQIGRITAAIVQLRRVRCLHNADGIVEQLSRAQRDVIEGVPTPNERARKARLAG